MGESSGHEFRGNQYGAGGGGKKAGSEKQAPRGNAVAGSASHVGRDGAMTRADGSSHFKYNPSDAEHARTVAVMSARHAANPEYYSTPVKSMILTPTGIEYDDAFVKAHQNFDQKADDVAHASAILATPMPGRVGAEDKAWAEKTLAGHAESGHPGAVAALAAHAGHAVTQSTSAHVAVGRMPGSSVRGVPRSGGSGKRGK